MTGNIHSFDDKYDGMVYYPTEMGVQLSNFRLSENDVFDIVQISILPDSTISASSCVRQDAPTRRAWCFHQAHTAE